MLVKSTENDSLMIDMRRSCRCGHDSADREPEPEPEPETHSQSQELSVWVLYGKGQGWG